MIELNNNTDSATNPTILASRRHSIRTGLAYLVWIIEAPDHSSSALRAKCVALAVKPDILMGATQMELAAEHGVTHTTVQNLRKKALEILVSLN